MDSAVYAHYETGDYTPPEVILDDKEYGKALDTIVKGVPFSYNKMLSYCCLRSCSRCAALPIMKNSSALGKGLVMQAVWTSC